MSQYSCAKKDDKSSEGRAFGLKGRRKSAGSGNRKYLPYLRLAAKRIQVIAPAFRCERRRAGFGSIERAAKSGFGNRRRRIAIGGRENTGDRPDGILMPTNSLTRLLIGIIVLIAAGVRPTCRRSRVALTRRLDDGRATGNASIGRAPCVRCRFQSTYGRSDDHPMKGWRRVHPAKREEAGYGCDDVRQELCFHPM